MEIKTARIAIAATVGLAALGWFAFRPELLFINATVDEKLPQQANASTMRISVGSFVSLAHETTGKAEILTVGSKRYLRLSDFHTSNGPDVRVKLIRNGTTKEVDLGSIKGNVGNQNYELPADLAPDEIAAVSIWCERFSVGFGRADLQPEKKETTSLPSSTGFTLAGFSPDPQSTIAVTSGKVEGNRSWMGSARIEETSGKRFTVLNLTRTGAGKTEAILFKKESLRVGPAPTDPAAVPLGVIKRGEQRFSIGKDLDIWLYRSIGLIQNGKVVAFINLRSDQERNRNQLFL